MSTKAKGGVGGGYFPRYELNAHVRCRLPGNARAPIPIVPIDPIIDTAKQYNLVINNR